MLTVAHIAFADRVDAALSAAGIATRDELAARIGVAPSTLSESLKHASESIRLKTLLRLAKELRVSVEYLIEGLDPAYDATRSAAPVQAQVVELWQLAVQRGKAEAVWPVLAMAAGRDDLMLALPPPPPSRGLEREG
jgi:transcriptional regulator with XRE-family HTH domain